VQRVRSRTEGEKVVSKALADAAALRVVADPGLDRAAQSLLIKELRGQSNKESIVRETATILGTEPETASAEKPAEVADDWLNVFERFAEAASSERMQKQWARVLAGEIRKPGSFSLKTLSALSELDQEVAIIFEKYVDSVVFGDLIPIAANVSGEPFNELVHLQEFGLVTGVGAHVSRTFSLDGFSGLVLSYRVQAMYVEIVEGPLGRKLPIPGVLLTRVGRELYGMLAPQFNLARAHELVNMVDKTHVKSIRLGPYVEGRVYPTTSLWVRPADDAAPPK